MAKAGDVTLGPGGLPGTPRDLAPTRTATHSERNVAQGQYNDVTGFTVRGFLTDRDPDAPILPASYAPSFRVQYLDPVTQTWQIGTYTSLSDGRPHPQVYPMGFSADGSTDRIVVPWDTNITRIKVKGTGTATLNKNGVAAAGPFSPVAGWQAISPAVAYSEAADDDWSVTASGVSGFLSVAVSEP